MNERQRDYTWSELSIFAIGSIVGAILGVWTMSRLAAAMAASAPGFWFVSRAAGIVGYFMLWFSTAWGITLSSKGIGGLVSGPLSYALHNVTSWLALVFAAVHALSLLGDRIVPFTSAGVFLPFTATYQPFLSGLGSLSLYLGLLVTLAFYWKKRLGLRAWRTIHGLSYLMFVAVTIHGTFLGTDSTTLVMQAVYLVAGSSVLFLTIFRILTAGAGRSTLRETSSAASR